MPKRITTLTPEQTARIPEWVEKWVAIGLSTEPADFDRATAAALACYDAAGLRRPRLVLRMGSPLAAVVGGVLGANRSKASVDNTDGREVLSHVRSDVLRKIWSEVEGQVANQAKIWIAKEVSNQLWRHVGDHVSTRTWSQVGNQVGSQLWNHVGDHFATEGALHQYRGGQAYVGWHARISFLRDVCGWKNPTLSRFAQEEALALNCGWTWWHHDVVAMSDRPRLLRRDQSGRLHSESGPALQYPDGWSLYCWHGHLLPPSHQWLIAGRHKLTAEVIDAERNAELRRIALEIYGFDRYLAERNASVIAEDEWHGQRRRLLSCNVGGETVRILELTNGTVEPDGTRRKFHLGAMPGETPHDCVAASFGRPAGKYREAIGA